MNSIVPELGFVLPHNHVEQRGLAGAIRADHHMQLVAVDIEVQPVHGLEAVERDAEVVNFEDGCGHQRGSCVPRKRSNAPARPLGNTIVVKMKTTPMKYIHKLGNCSESMLFARQIIRVP